MEEDQLEVFKSQREWEKKVTQLKRNLMIFVGIIVAMLVFSCAYLFVKVQNLQKQLEVNEQETITTSLQGNNSSSKNINEQTSNKNQTEDETKDTLVDIEDNQQPEESPESVVNDEPDTKKVYLTFDDGPSGNTEAILDVLDTYHVKATFFVIGNVSNSEELVPLYQEIINRGHTIGIHSYSHKYDTIYQSLDAFEQDYTQIQSYLQDTAGITSSIYRFPGGSGNTVSAVDMHSFIQYLTEKDITYYDWNVDSKDASGENLSVSQLVANTMSGINNNNTSIVLMHDKDDKDNTVEALKQVIEQVQSQGIEILPITEDTTPIQQIKAE